MTIPGEGGAEEVIQSAHEVNGDIRGGGQDPFEEVFLGWVLIEKHKVIYMQAHMGGGSWGCSDGGMPDN